MVNESALNIIKNNGLDIPTHIEQILKNLSYDSFHVLAKIDSNSFSEIIDDVRSILADKDHLKDLNDVQRIQLFGRFFARKPEYFRFTSGKHVESYELNLLISQYLGEKSLLLAIAEMSKHLLSTMKPASLKPMDLQPPRSPRKSTSAHVVGCNWA